MMASPGGKKKISVLDLTSIITCSFMSCEEYLGWVQKFWYLGMLLVMKI